MTIIETNTPALCVEVLEKKRQCFHSKDLGTLRKQLQSLPSATGNSPAHRPATAGRLSGSFGI
jgi:hypothetical protein